MSETIVVGIDITKQTFEAAIGIHGSIETFTNDANGHDAFFARLAGVKVELFVMEATGGLERALACLLQASGFAVAVVNPRQARNFAKAMGYLAKTDRIDARALAELAQTLARHPQRARLLRPLPSPEQQLLQGPVTRRRQPVSSLVIEQQRLFSCHPNLRKNVEALIESIQARLDEIEAVMTRHIETHHAKLAKLLASVRGVGPVTVAALIAEVPELGRLSAAWLSLIVGVLAAGRTYPR